MNINRLYMVLSLFFLVSPSLYSTELQLHYLDKKNPEELFGKGQYVITMEHFSPTSFGQVFFFMDASSKRDRVPESDSVYFEANIGLSFKKLFNMQSKGILDDIRFHIELDDSGESYINRRSLYGFDFAFKNSIFPVLDLSLLYSDESHKDSGHWQATLVWFKDFKLGNQVFFFRGFADYWETDDGQGNDINIFLCQPQFVWKMSKSLLLGTELEFSDNFYFQNKGEFNYSIFVALTF